MSAYFISCDWGTSSFRLRLINSDELRVIAEIKNGVGIAETFQSWQIVKDKVKREEFYIDIIKEQIAELSNQNLNNISLVDVPVVLSGMASSTIGLLDIPYKQLPFALDGSDLNVKVLRTHIPDHPIIIISGACTDIDVMRGEETKVLGCAHFFDEDYRDLLLVMPGTHPKHMTIVNSEVRSFKTYMTGEFFDLLAGHSVLAASVQSNSDLEDIHCKQHFKEGLSAALQGNFLNNSFMVRTRQVLQKVPAKYNYHYMSGVLIGTELKDLDRTIPLYLVSSGIHTKLYTMACEVLGITVNRVVDADEALIRGQRIVLSMIRLRS